MKISEMTNDQATTALLRIAGPLSSIADDEEAVAMMDEIKALEKAGVRVERATARMIPKFVNYGLKKHKKDFYEIIGALAMKPTAQVGGMNILQTVQLIRDSWDDISASFFTRSGGARRSSAESSSAKSTETAGAAGTP